MTRRPHGARHDLLGASHQEDASHDEDGTGVGAEAKQIYDDSFIEKHESVISYNLRCGNLG